MRVTRSVHHQSSAVLRGLFNGDNTNSVNQVPESWPIEIEQRSGEVHRRMIVEQASPGELDDRLGDSALPRRGRSVEVKQSHRFVTATLAPNDQVQRAGATAVDASIKLSRAGSAATASSAPLVLRISEAVPRRFENTPRSWIAPRWGLFQWAR
jgi:hypothetical protein